MSLNLKTKLSRAALLFSAASVLLADNVVVVDPSYTGSIWQTWKTSQISNQPWQTSQTVPNQPYWNNSSWDGKNENVGACLALASSACAISNQPGAIPYLGQSNGKAFNNFYFSGGTPDTVTMEAQVAGDAAYDVFGWYNVNNPSQYGVIFDGDTKIGSTVTFTPTADYGFFFYNDAPGQDDLYLTDDQLSPSDPGVQHFAVFDQSPGTYYLGMEDLPSSNTDFDYNDMIVKISTAGVPEPASLLLLGSGLLGIGALRFRRKTTAKSK